MVYQGTGVAGWDYKGGGRLGTEDCGDWESEYSGVCTLRVVYVVVEPGFGFLVDLSCLSLVILSPENRISAFLLAQSCNSKCHFFSKFDCLVRKNLECPDVLLRMSYCACLPLRLVRKTF